MYPITFLLSKGAKLEFTPAMDFVVPENVAELAAQPMLVSPN